MEPALEADRGAADKGQEQRRVSARKEGRARQGVYYPGAPHGLTATHADQFNADLLAFIRS